MMLKKILVVSFILTIVIFLGISPLKANTCTGYMDGEWFVIEGANNGNFTYEHPFWSTSSNPRTCTEDVYCVQLAVLSHSKIKLRGNFDFGVIDPEPGDDSWYFIKAGSVALPNTVEIVGQNATINNGRFNFFVDVFPGGSGSQKIKIKNLTLVNPAEAAIGLYGDCHSIAIDNIKVKGVRAITHPEWDGEGMKNFVSAGGTYRFVWGFWDALKVGCISITNCHIDLGSYSSVKHEGLAARIWGVGTPENPTKILIKNNKIHNTSWHSLFVGAYAGAAKIKGNIIRTGTHAVDYGDFDGIKFHQTPSWKFNFPDGSQGPYEAGWAHMTVVKNDLVVGPIADKDIADKVLTFGIAGDHMPDVVIKKNRIKVNDALAHVVLTTGNNDGALIEKNIFSGTGSPSFTIGLGYTNNSLIRNNNFKAVNPTIAHIYCAAGPGGDGWVENNVFKGNKATGNKPIYYFDGIAVNNIVRGCCGGADKVVDIPYDAPKKVRFADFDDETWWIDAEYFFEDLSNWMDAYKDGDPAKPYNYLYEPYFAADWWFTQLPHDIYLPITDPMLTLEVSGVEITIPMPFYYKTSDGDSDSFVDWDLGGTLQPNPVRGPLKNNIITGCKHGDDDRKWRKRGKRRPR